MEVQSIKVNHFYRTRIEVLSINILDLFMIMKLYFSFRFIRLKGLSLAFLLKIMNHIRKTVRKENVSERN